MKPRAPLRTAVMLIAGSRLHLADLVHAVDRVGSELYAGSLLAIRSVSGFLGISMKTTIGG